MWQVYERTCLEIWRLANRVLFKGKLLREPHFRVWDAGDCSGHFHDVYGNPVIEIHEVLFQKELNHEILETIVHEMVHQLQWQLGKPVKHDGYFNETLEEVWDGQSY